MRVLLDTNILLTYLSGREDRYSSECEKIVKLCADEEIEGVVAFHSLSTIWYVMRKAPEEMRRACIKRLCILFTIAGADNEAILEAVENRGFRDFEDALQDCCAAESDCDYIITANGKDFIGHSHTAVKSPAELIALIEQAR